VFSWAIWVLGWNPVVRSKLSKLRVICSKKNEIIFSNTAKTILSIEDKNPSFAKRLASGGDR
jgi:hypothetical protein